MRQRIIVCLMILDYLQFWFTANNEHGTHSPFVFNLLTRGLYPSDRRWKGQSRKQQFIDRLLVYFEPHYIGVLDKQALSTKTNRDMVVFQRESTTPYDCLIFNGTTASSWPSIATVSSLLHNDSFWIIDRRGKEASVEKYWQEVVASEEMIVTLDFYYFGVAFKRKEQLKQHFTLRLQPDRIFRLLRV